MKRKLWGEFNKDSSKKHGFRRSDIVLSSQQKPEKLEKLKSTSSDEEDEVKQVEIENSLVTQTVEVMNQKEMLHTVIDVYSSKTSCDNYVLNPCHLLPQVDFPPENAANLLNTEKFIKPLWFIPPIETDFVKGLPKNYTKINQKIARCSIRKSICGLLRIAGFNEATDSSLVMFTDAVDEFIKILLTQVRDVKINNDTEKSPELDVLTLEKAYCDLTHNSLLTIHNYFKNVIIAKNTSEINEFKNIYQEYNKLMKESQNNMQQKVQIKEEDYMNFLDFPESTTVTTQQQPNAVGNALMNLLENSSHSGNYNNIMNELQSEIMEQAKQHRQSTLQPQQSEQVNCTTTGTPPTLE